MRFWVDSYNLPKHPRWSNDWFTPDSSGANVFNKKMLYRAPGGDYEVFNGAVKNRGEYMIRFGADSTSDIWNARAVRLYVNVL